VAGKFLLTTLPTALGSGVRIPYTLAVARFGGRNWTCISACLLLVPTVAAAIVLRPGVSYGTLLMVSALAGVGGGNFASSMANINSFYPQRLKGRALGLNAGGGNIGVAVVQLAGLAVLAAAGKGHPRVMLGIYIPAVVIAALCAALFMDNVAHVRNQKHAMRSACRDAHTWIISFLYIGTFGSFIGYSFAFGQVLQNQFGTHFLTGGKVDPVKIAYLTFLGPLVGSLLRPAGGALADRIGGARDVLELPRDGGGRGRRARHVRAAVAPAVLRRLHRLVRAVGPGQRIDVQDDPGGLRGAGRRRGCRQGGRRA
jgi:NNP family nitrate/nitrite transporter-like MFS transporter